MEGFWFRGWNLAPLSGADSTNADQRSARGVEASTPCGAISTLGPPFSFPVSGACR